MKLRVLGCAGAELPDFRPPAFLLDDQLLLDAGTIGSVLSEEDQWKIHSICILRGGKIKFHLAGIIRAIKGSSI
jgi:hypothetical protein